MTEHRNTYKALCSSTLFTTTNQANLTDSINNYRELIFWLRNNSGRVYVSITIPVSAFRTLSTSTRSIGLEIYTDKRIYASIWYNSDVSVSHYSSEDNNNFYWQILGLK